MPPKTESKVQPPTPPASSHPTPPPPGPPSHPTTGQGLRPREQMLKRGREEQGLKAAGSSAGHGTRYAHSARLGAIAWAFLALGILTAQTGARLPALKLAHGLTDGMLSVWLSAEDIGLLLLLPVAGAVIARIGAVRVGVGGGTAGCCWRAWRPPPRSWAWR